MGGKKEKEKEKEKEPPIIRPEAKIKIVQPLQRDDECLKQLRPGIQWGEEEEEEQQR